MKQRYNVYRYLYISKDNWLDQIHGDYITTEEMNRRKDATGGNSDSNNDNSNGATVHNNEQGEVMFRLPNNEHIHISKVELFINKEQIIAIQILVTF